LRNPIKKTSSAECAISDHMLTGTGPIDECAICQQGLAHLPPEVSVANYFEVTPYIEAGGQAGNQAIDGDRRTDILNDISFRPDARGARKSEHVQHYQSKVLAQSTTLTAHLVPAISQ